MTDFNPEALPDPGTGPAIPGTDWTPLVMPMAPHAVGATFSVARVVRWSPDGLVTAYERGKVLGAFPTFEDARAAVEGEVAGLLRAGPEVRGRLIREHAARVSELLEANNREVERRRAAERDLRRLAGERATADEIAMWAARAIEAVPPDTEETAGLHVNTVAAIVLDAIQRDRAAQSNTARRWRHGERGSVYAEVARGELQRSDMRPLVEGTRMVAYRGEDGRVWFSAEREFWDGHFEELTCTAQS